MEWMILPFKRYADFRGRSRRMEFWMFQLFYWIVTILFFALIFSAFPWRDIMSDRMDPDSMPEFGALWIGGMILYFLFYICTFIPALAVTVRRLHDRGLSGWWYAGLMLGGFVPIVNVLVLPGYLVLLVFLFLPGEESPNKWGPSPKDPGQASVFA